MSSFEFQSCRDYPYFAITKIERFSPLEYYLDLARAIKQSEIPAAVMEEMKKDAQSKYVDERRTEFFYQGKCYSLKYGPNAPCCYYSVADVITDKILEQWDPLHELDALLNKSIMWNDITTVAKLPTAQRPYFHYFDDPDKKQEKNQVLVVISSNLATLAKLTVEPRFNV